MASTEPSDDGAGGTEPQYERETAHRVFAMELNATQLSIQPGEGERAPRYAVLPTGAKVNRVIVAGELVEKSRNQETGRVKALVDDGTNGPDYYMYAGQFYPDSRDQMAAIDEGSLVSVTGKPRVYEGEQGDMLVAVRPESFTPIEEATRDRWVRDAAMWTDRRAKRFIRTVEETPRDEWPDGVAVAADYYLGAGGSDVAEFVQPFRSAASTAMRRVCTDD